MNATTNKLKNAGGWIGNWCSSFFATNEPTWIAIGVVFGAVISWKKPKNKNKQATP
jgi:hypothetical protein